MSQIQSSTSAGNGFLYQMLYAEKEFDHEAARQWTDSIKTVSLWLSAIYVILIFSGKRWMRSRSPFGLRFPLFLWSSVLSVFSILGSFHTVPELYNGLLNYGLTYTLCDCSFLRGSSGFWAFAFTLSKAYELGDTLFIVLRRQPLIFLHWYHHISVMIYCFYTYSDHVPWARWYIAMNYCVHSVMYTYYAARALRVRVPSFIRMLVTLLQIIQMTVGLVLSIYAFLIKRSGADCHPSYANLVAGMLLYISYLILFVHFFYEQYAAPVRKKSSDDKMPDTSLDEVKKLR